MAVPMYDHVLERVVQMQPFRALNIGDFQPSLVEAYQARPHALKSAAEMVTHLQTGFAGTQLLEVHASADILPTKRTVASATKTATRELRI